MSTVVHLKDYLQARLKSKESLFPEYDWATDYPSLDPRQGFYKSSCFGNSGKVLRHRNSTSCIPDYLILVQECTKSTAIALDLSLYNSWIENTILTDVLTVQESNSTVQYVPKVKHLLGKHIRKSQNCQSGYYQNYEVYHAQSRRIKPLNTIQDAEPQFNPLSQNLRVITECGVEIRLESGIIHSPIHFRDIKTGNELKTLQYLNYKYRPNMECEWVITAQSKDQKIGIKFLYFDLHPGFDKLEIEDEDGTEIARFGAGKPTRTIISGTHQIRLRFQTDYEGERRGFSLSFQPVQVPDCGGDYFTQSGTIHSPNFPFFYPPATTCTWSITVPGPGTIKVDFSVLNLHQTDNIEFRDGLDESAPYICSVSGNFSNPIYSTGNSIQIIFKTNDWGQSEGFRARFQSQDRLCGGREILNQNSISLSQPNLDQQGQYRQGYVSCRWEVVAKPRHFINLQFDALSFGSASTQCTTGYLELNDAATDSDHMQRFCQGMGGKEWRSLSNKIYLDYFNNMENNKSKLSIRLDQIRGCVIPGLPSLGTKITCQYSAVNRNKLTCILDCKLGFRGMSSDCYLYHGTWNMNLHCSKINRNPSQFQRGRKNPSQFQESMRNPSQFQEVRRNPSTFREARMEGLSRSQNSTRNANRTQGTQYKSEYSNRSRVKKYLKEFVVGREIRKVKEYRGKRKRNIMNKLRRMRKEISNVESKHKRDLKAKTKRMRIRKRLLQKVASCRHEELTGCIMPPPVENTGVECTVSKGGTECRVSCSGGLVSPSDYTVCQRDRSGWEGRWSRIIRPCQPDCSQTVPRIPDGKVSCTASGETKLKCTVYCRSGFVGSLYSQPMENPVTTFSCFRGDWIGVPSCILLPS
ncbi:uncharacterized protein LOC111705771 [Eurytemora carolleeae]|uniref:uncharacterized protein LOC111705771 n=1 Tax=Eurytemora carolleeae TaxID=1294199 RepID=UPI000C77C439|nr:uncharacterized protein LOC111705771 [Eurytemora carolleeae]|eukprot:XP_023334189.1 uncharacterized protein LOC111705771 [Eurytemora affinis]